METEKTPTKGEMVLREKLTPMDKSLLVEIIIATYTSLLTGIANAQKPNQTLNNESKKNLIPIKLAAHYINQEYAKCDRPDLVTHRMITKWERTPGKAPNGYSRELRLDQTTLIKWAAESAQRGIRLQHRSHWTKNTLSQTKAADILTKYYLESGKSVKITGSEVSSWELGKSVAPIGYSKKLREDKPAYMIWAKQTATATTTSTPQQSDFLEEFGIK